MEASAVQCPKCGGFSPAEEDSDSQPATAQGDLSPDTATGLDPELEATLNERFEKGRRKAARRSNRRSLPY